MTDEIETEGQPPAQDPAPASQPQEAPEPSEESEGQEPQLNEVERIAAQMGWAPKDQWKGPPDAHRSAEEYILRAPEIVRELKNARDRDRADFEDRARRLEAMSAVALQRQRDQIERDYAAAMRNAAATGDVEAYDNLQRGLEQDRRAFAEQLAPVMQQQPRQQAQQEPEIPREVVDFATRNASWYMKDKGLSGYAIGFLDEVEAQFPHLPLGNKLQIVEQHMRETFPAKFNKAQGNNNSGPASVEGGLRQIRTTRGKGFNELPPEAKSAAARFVEQGAYKTVHDYAKEYWSQGD